MTHLKGLIKVVRGVSCGNSNSAMYYFFPWPRYNQKPEAT